MSIVNSKLVSVVSLVCISCFCKAQIKGSIKDQRTGKPLSEVEVFVNQSSIYALSDGDGNFELSSPPEGFVELVLWKEGFELYKSRMRIQSGKAYNLNLGLSSVKKKRSATMQRRNKADQELGYRKVEWFIDGEPMAVRYEMMASDSLRQTLTWEKRRKEIYEGSLTHLLKALAAGKTAAEGFELNRDGKVIEASEVIKPTGQPGYYRLQSEDPVEVVYKRSTEGTEVTRSELVVAEGIDFNSGGSVLDAKRMTVTGNLTHDQGRLPINYVPIEGDVEEAYKETLLRFYEKVYVHTDKPYYYQGEPMWFKAYLSYYYPAWRDSLSKVLYVELISPEKKIIMERILKIENGSAHGDFILPDTLRRGDYYLRAYTNLQRNFGDENLYVKHIPILGITDKVEFDKNSQESFSNVFFKFRTDKIRYKKREKVTLTIELPNNVFTSSLSISVTDQHQVKPLKISETIENEFTRSNPIAIGNSLKYSIENGITVKGHVLGHKNGELFLSMINVGSKDLAVIQSEEDGSFFFDHLDFYDSTRFIFKVPGPEKKALEIELYPREIPPIKSMKATRLNIVDGNSPQRIISEYEVPREAKLLEEVVITGRTITAEQLRSYGRSDVVITEENINRAYPNILYSLVGIPGVVVDPMGGSIYMTRSRGLSVNGSRPPLIMVNDVPVDKSALSTIDPANVESIEVTKRINVMYGSQGANGVVSIYTKTGPIEREDVVDKDFQIVGMKGYSRPREFPFIDYESETSLINVDQADYRSTLYWNPELTLNTGENSIEVSFHAADLIGLYRVVVEGLVNGNPVTGEFEIIVGED